MRSTGKETEPGSHQTRRGLPKGAPTGHGSAARPGAAPGRRPRPAPAPATAAALIAVLPSARSAWLVPGRSGATARYGSPWRLRFARSGFQDPAAVRTCWRRGWQHVGGGGLGDALVFTRAPITRPGWFGSGTGLGP